MTRIDQPANRRRRLILESSWLAYMVFTIVGYPSFSVSVMLPSILLCGLATSLYSTRAGLLTALATLFYHMMLLIDCTGDPGNWIMAWEPGGLAAQLLAVGFVSKAKTARDKSIELNHEIERRIQERTAELAEVTEFMEHRAEAEYERMSKTLQMVADDQLQTLFMHSETLQNFLTYNNQPHADAAIKLVAIAKENIEQVKNLRRRLSSGNIAETGIEHAIRDMCTYLNKTTGTRFSVIVQDISSDAAEHTVFTIYRIVHEAVTNALRHGKAKAVDIKLDITANAFDLEIINDGLPWRGLTSEGIGIQLMRQQAARIGATVEYTTDASERTILRCATTP